MNSRELTRQPGFPQRPDWRWLGGIALMLGLLIAAYTAGCMVGREQERDHQQARLAQSRACDADPACLRP